MNTLSTLTNFEIEENLKKLVTKERQLLHIILEHIKEVDNRRLYLEKAYSSLYEYLTQELQYSGSAAMRRIEAARLLNSVPELREKIQNGSVNLSQIGELSKAIKEKEKSCGNKVSLQQKTELLSMISSKTTQDTQKELARALDIQVIEHDKKRVQQDESVRIEMTVSKELYEKLMKCRDLASHKIEQKENSSSLAAVLEVLADRYLNQPSPSENKKSPATEKINKTVTPKTKLEIINRDECCQYISPLTGKQCSCTYLPQIDHKTSQWAGGTNAKNNLQLLCANHNKQKYRTEAQITLRTDAVVNHEAQRPARTAGLPGVRG